MYFVIDLLLQRKIQVIPDGQSDLFLLERGVALTLATVLNQLEVNVIIISVVRIQINVSTVFRIYVL